MKVSVVLLAVLLAVCVTMATARRNKRKNRDGCRYQKGSWSACDAATNTQTLTKTLRAGSSDGCEPTKLKIKPCRNKCKYRKTGDWSQCDADQKRHLTLVLNKDKSGSNCPETKTKTKDCRKAGRRPAKGCKYTKMVWTPCVNGMRTGRKALRKGANTCEPTFTKSVRCFSA